MSWKRPWTTQQNSSRTWGLASFPPPEPTARSRAPCLVALVPLRLRRLVKQEPVMQLSFRSGDSPWIPCGKGQLARRNRLLSSYQAVTWVFQPTICNSFPIGNWPVERAKLRTMMDWFRSIRNLFSILSRSCKASWLASLLCVCVSGRERITPWMIITRLGIET